MTESERERIIDRRVARRLYQDRAYIHAESNETAAQREKEITAEIERELDKDDQAR